MMNKLAMVVVFGLLLVSAQAMAESPRVFQAVEIVAAEVPPESGMFTTAEGAAWLKRSPYRVDGRIMAKVDNSNTPYTIWWVVFNKPQNCLPPGCGLADLLADGGAAAEVAVFNASGAISAASGALKRNGKPAEGGVINVDVSVITGEGASNGSQNPIAPLPFFERLFTKGNGLCAEIHLDINEHVFDTDWVFELTYLENPQGFAIFPPVEGAECSDNGE